MYGPDVTFLGVQRCDLDQPATLEGADAFLANQVVLEMLSGIAFRRQGGTWDSIPRTLLEDRN
jgi:hypothetical protein